MLWLNFIHLYQPANSQSERIKEAVDKSYLRLTRLLEEHPALHFTANISGCLLERLRDDGFTDLLARWRVLVKSGRLELVGSAAYHGFLPFLPEEEILYQIKRQEEITADILGVDLRGGGFFLPEMAYTPVLAQLLKKSGYSWLILDEASLPDKAMPREQAAYLDINSDLRVLVRQRDYSNTYIPDLIKKLSDHNSQPSLLVTATDAELYGLRHEDPTAKLEKMVSLPDLQTATISDFLSTAKTEPLIFQSASWETDRSQDRSQVFAVWRNPHNRLQKDLWKLADIILAAGKKYNNDVNYAAYRWHLDRGLASCMFWWASGRDFFQNFGPKAWNPDEVENGLNDLIRAVRSLQDKRSSREKVVAEKLLSRIRFRLWRRHWQKYF
jgi:predicted glycosyl hydrolase (DUF1957 family)